MTRIENEIGLLQGEGIGSGIRPLFEHLIAYAPHEDTRVIAVALHQVGEVALMPLVEETA